MLPIHPVRGIHAGLASFRKVLYVSEDELNS